MVAHEFTFKDDDSFMCVNCGMYTDFDGMDRGGVCKPCVVCNTVHTCNVTTTVTPMGKVTTHEKSYGSECECCWLASK